MSAVAALLQRGGGPANAALVEGMLRCMGRRGRDRSRVVSTPTVTLGVARHEWEMGPGFSGPVLVAEAPGLQVAADGALYYRDELRAALEKDGVPSAGETPSHLILAAYRAWGERGFERLEGDFAFVLWDARRDTLFCVRGPFGARPLFYAVLGDAVVAASSSAAVLQHPRCPGGLNLAFVTEVASGLFGVGDETAWASVAQVEAGHAVTFSRDGVRPLRFWRPPTPTPFRPASPEDGARELRHLLGRAVLARMDPVAPSSLWMSGGRDSTALFGVGREAGGRDAPSLRPVSVAYPPGDPGRENAYIEAVVEHGGSATHWIDSREISDLAALERSPGSREDAFFHPFENTHRALVAGSRAVGARVAFSGDGGDGLFALSPAYLSELFYRGRWVDLVEEWAARDVRRGRARVFWRWVVRPGLPAWMGASLAGVRGGGIAAGHLEPALPPWIRRSAVRHYRIGERQRRFWRDRMPPGPVARELHWSLVSPLASLSASTVAGLGLEGGVEVRRPFLDRRVIELAATRPWWEKASGTGRKALLRRSMVGLLPGEVLADRRHRTGVANAAWLRAVRVALPGKVRSAFRESRLADLGLVEVRELLCVADACARGDARWAGDLLRTLHAELWVRAHLDAGQLPESSAAGARVAETRRGVA